MLPLRNHSELRGQLQHAVVTYKAPCDVFLQVFHVAVCGFVGCRRFVGAAACWAVPWGSIISQGRKKWFNPGDQSSQRMDLTYKREIQRFNGVEKNASVQCCQGAAPLRPGGDALRNKGRGTVTRGAASHWESAVAGSRCGPHSAGKKQCMCASRRGVALYSSILRPCMCSGAAPGAGAALGASFSTAP